MIRKILRKLKRIYKKVTKPKILRRLTTSGTTQPRLSKVKSNNKVYSFTGSTERIFDDIAQNSNDIFQDFSKEHKVLIKINLNSALPYPASTDPKTLSMVIDILKARGITDIKVGDCSSISSLPTRRVARQAGILAVINGKAQFINFDKEEWVSVSINGEYLNNPVIPKCVYSADRIIYLACMKNHRDADFSMSMKHSVGFMHPMQRYDLHKEYLQEKIVEMSLAVRPDLVILDAREPFITNGPYYGKTKKGNCIFIGKDLLSVDLAGYQLLYKLKFDNDCVGGFTESPYQMRQFIHAKKVFGREDSL